MTDDGIRLAKRVAEVVGCSRAEAERYIAGGWVSVDGAMVEDPATRVAPAQVVALLPGAHASEPTPATILLHKPAGVDAAEVLALITADNQAAGQPSNQAASHGAPAQRLLKRHLTKLAVLAPLEKEASGLLVLSQDWRITRKLSVDADRIEHEYVAEVSGAIVENGMSRLNAGGAYPLKASWQSEGRLRFAGKGIEPGRIADLCAGVGLKVTSLRRLRIGRMALAGLPAGRWRFMGEFEKF
jgi:23S rRNA pseudouridine2604 synthase